MAFRNELLRKIAQLENEKSDLQDSVRRLSVALNHKKEEQKDIDWNNLLSSQFKKNMNLIHKDVSEHETVSQEYDGHTD